MRNAVLARLYALGARALVPPLVALQFLTRVPVTLRNAPGPRQLAHSLIWYPVIGAAIGWLVARSGLGIASIVMGPYPAVVLMLLAGVMLTGAMHEDGLADVADGFGGGRTADDVLRIMRDSRIGTYGVIALLLAFAMRGALLVDMPASLWIPVLVVAHACSRWTCVGLLLALPYARGPSERPGAAALLREGLTPRHAIIATVVTAGVAILAVGVIAGLIAVAVALVTAVLAGRYYRERISGITGDCVGATVVVSELAIMAALVAVMDARELADSTQLVAALVAVMDARELADSTQLVAALWP